MEPLALVAVEAAAVEVTDEEDPVVVIVEALVVCLLGGVLCTGLRIIGPDDEEVAAINMAHLPGRSPGIFYRQDHEVL